MIDPLGLFWDEAWATVKKSVGNAIVGPVFSSSAAIVILVATEKEMKNANVTGGDQFFHCLAFCSIQKSAFSSDAMGYSAGILKEATDYVRGRFGKYGDGKVRGHSAMLEDNFEDLAANGYGMTCPASTDCGEHCKELIDKNNFAKSYDYLSDKGYFAK